MPLTADVLASRILQALEASGFTQQTLANTINMESSALSKALSGKRNFKPLEVALISEALGVPVQSLLADPDLEPEPVSIAARVQPDSSPAVEEALVRTEQILELDQLLRSRGFEAASMPRVPRPARGQPYEQGEVLAERARGKLGIGDTDLPPEIGLLAAVIEDEFNIDIAIEPLPPGLDGLAVTRPHYRLIMVNSTIPATRQRYTLGHEFAHILAGDGSEIIDRDILAGKTPQEARANAFAAAFLMPATALRSAFKGSAAPTQTLVADLLGRYRVSLDALAFRLHNADIINAAGRDGVRRMTSARIGLRQGRATDLQARRERRLPQGVLNRAIEAYVKGRISIRPIANLVGIDPDTLLEELSPPRLPARSPLAMTSHDDELVPML
jgi:Zn-dependent peptidase ImmA (M78 family)/transcriptional regulator with XRE-family HTH domain